MTRTLSIALAVLLVAPALPAQTAPATFLSAADVVARLQQARTTTPEMIMARMDAGASATPATIRDGDIRTVRSGHLVLVRFDVKER